MNSFGSLSSLSSFGSFGWGFATAFHPLRPLLPRLLRPFPRRIPRGTRGAARRGWAGRRAEGWSRAAARRSGADGATSLCVSDERREQTGRIETKHEQGLEVAKRVGFLGGSEAADEGILLANVENAQRTLALEKESLVDVLGAEMREIEETEQRAVAGDPRRHGDENERVGEPARARDDLILLQFNKRENKSTSTMPHVMRHMSSSLMYTQMSVAE